MKQDDEKRNGIRRIIRKPGCPVCSTPEQLKPPHDASPWCESGKRQHFTCDTCF